MSKSYALLVGVLLVILGSFTATAAWSGHEIQDFNNEASDWVGRTASADGYEEATGWTFTNFAGNAVGEVHAKFHRIQTNTDQPNEATSYYADTDLNGTLDVSQQVLYATGDLYIDDFTQYPDFGGGIWLGWFRPGGQCRIGIMFNDNGGPGAGWYAGIWNNSVLIGQTFIGSVAKGVKYHFEIEFDNNEGVNSMGRLVAKLTPEGGDTETAIIHLTEKLSDYELSAFGLARPNPVNAGGSQTMMDIYLDDLRYTSNAIPYPQQAPKEYQFFLSNPTDWTTRVNTGGIYTEIAGFSETNFAGSGSGEARAKFHRLHSTTDQPSDVISWYADTGLGGGLNVENQILEANGKFIIKDFASYPDLGTGVWLGWFRPGGASRMGIMINNNEPYGGAGLGWYAGIYNNWGQLIAQQFMGSVSADLKYSFEIEFNNRDGENGKGRLVCKITPEGYATETAVVHLANYLSNYEFTAFGLSRPNPGLYELWNYKAIDIYADDLAYTSNIQGTLPTLSISDAKLSANSANVTSSGVVTAVNWDYYYIQSENRYNGIRIDQMNSGRTPGDLVTISGTVLTLDSGEKCITNPQLLNSESGHDVDPVAMAQKSLGGGDYAYNSTTGAGQQEVAGCTGINNIGLLIRVAGSAKYIDDSTFTINDGSGRDIKVVCPYGSAPGTGSFVIVTGISSCEKDAVTELLSSVVLVPLQGGDIQPVSQQ